VHIDRIESVQKQFLLFALRGFKWDQNVKLPSNSRTSSVCLNSVEASTDSEIANLFAEFFQTTYRLASWSNSN